MPIRTADIFNRKAQANNFIAAFRRGILTVSRVILTVGIGDFQGFGGQCVADIGGQLLLALCGGCCAVSFGNRGIILAAAERKAGEQTENQNG